jgi:hypothetical protein
MRRCSGLRSFFRACTCPFMPGSRSLATGNYSGCARKSLKTTSRCMSLLIRSRTIWWLTPRWLEVRHHRSEESRKTWRKPTISRSCTETMEIPESRPICRTGLWRKKRAMRLDIVIRMSSLSQQRLHLCLAREQLRRAGQPRRRQHVADGRNAIRTDCRCYGTGMDRPAERQSLPGHERRYLYDPDCVHHTLLRNDDVSQFATVSSSAGTYPKMGYAGPPRRRTPKVRVKSPFI